MPPRETGIETLGQDSSSRRRPSKCTSSTSWRSWVPVIAHKRWRSPCVVASSNWAKGNPRKGPSTTKSGSKKIRAIASLISIAKRGDALQRILVPKGRRMLTLAQGGASDGGHPRNAREAEEVIPAPDG